MTSSLLAFSACGGDDTRSVSSAGGAGGGGGAAGTDIGNGGDPSSGGSNGGGSGGPAGGSGGDSSGGAVAVGGNPDAGPPPLDLSCLELTQLRGWAVDPSAIAELFTVATCDGQPVPACELDATDGSCIKEPGCLCASDFLLEEDGLPISVSESGFGIQESRGLRVYVNLLLDMSNSTSGNVRTQLIDGAKQFLDQLPQGREVYVGIQLFDGSTTIDTFQLPVRDPQKVKDRLDALAAYVARDGASTNLNGASVEAVQWLQNRQTQVIQQNDNGVVTVGYIVLFTDGADTAGRVPLDNAQSTLASARTVSGSASVVETTVSTYAVALRSADYVDGALQDLFSGSTLSGGAIGACTDSCVFAFDGACDDGRPGAAFSACELGTDCADCGIWNGDTGNVGTVDGSRFVFEAADATQLSQSFDQLAAAITSQLQGTYLLAYCSPKRSGTHRLTVNVQPSVSSQSNGFDFTFDASAFTGGCSADFLTNSCGDSVQFPNGRCGGFNCGACDEQRYVCDPVTDQCVDACLDRNVCDGSTIVNGFGFDQVCEFTDIDQCGSACVDFQTDTSHCGQCNNFCPAGVSCVAGVCDCPGTDVGCSGACYDLQTANAHCGACGNNCGGSATCQSGSCVCTTVGLTFCSGGCYDTATNNTHCGTCGNTCQSGTETCTAGSCGCAAGTTDCSGQCIFTTNDEINCGACGTACGRDEVCSGGTCVATGSAIGSCDDLELSSTTTLTFDTMVSDASLAQGTCNGSGNAIALSWRAPQAGTYQITVTGGTGDAYYTPQFGISTSCGSLSSCRDSGGTTTINATADQRDFLIIIDSPTANDQFTVNIAPQ